MFDKLFNMKRLLLLTINRGETDGLKSALRIRLTVTGTASALRALETVNGNVKLNTSSGMTSIGVDTGDVCWDDNYIYIKRSAGWKRSALSTF
jgi:hypothetical protein